MINKMDEDTRIAMDFIGQLEANFFAPPITFEFLPSTDEEMANNMQYAFGGQRWAENGDSFVQLGEDGSGSTYALWYYPGLTGKPPVVFMESEGDAVLVANDIKDFIRQMSKGQVFDRDTWSVPYESEYNDVNWNALARFVDEHYGLGKETPQQMMERANRAHPDFRQWCNSKNEYT